MYQDLIDKLRAEFPAHHLELTIYPSGGLIDATSCEECGSSTSAFAGWRYKKGPVRSLDEAVAMLRRNLADLG